jgi:crotonobetainyl-CoA:carnitine CoA-transferase CaiB-like acyl-CoA transferase
VQIVDMLTNVRVLDLTRLLPGGYATLQLADLGADVIKVEEPTVGDYMRDISPSGFELLNRNKRSISIDLKAASGRELLLRMTEGSDVLVESFRPGVMDRLGLGYQVVAERQPRIVYCSLSGYGQGGPYRLASGHDLNYQSVSGILHLLGAGGGELSPTRAAVGDLAGAMFAALSIIAALFRRQHTGQGQYIDASVTDALVSMGAHYAAGQRARGVDLAEMFERPTYGIFVTADGEQVAVCPMEDSFWGKLLSVLEPDDPLRAYQERRGPGISAARINSLLVDAVRSRTKPEWLTLAAEHDLPISPVNALGDLANDPHLATRDLFHDIPQQDGTVLSHVRFPALFSAAGPRRFDSAPVRGEHTETILAEYGLSVDEIKELRAQAALG